MAAGSTHEMVGWVVVVTDAQGRFRLDGMAKGEGNRLNVIPSDDHPYLMLKSVNVPTARGFDPIEMAIELRRGVFVRGKVLDQQTGQPVPATVHYHPFLSNEHAKRYATYDPNVHYALFDERRYRTAEDGSFQTVVIPGRGILSAQTMDYSDKYCVGIGSDQVSEMDERGRFLTYNPIPARMLNTMREIDVPADKPVVSYDLSLVPGRTAKLRLVDPEGRPLNGVRTAGLDTMQTMFLRQPQDTSEVRVIGLRDGERRPLIFYHEGRKLGGAMELVVSDQMKDSQVVRLEECGAVTGRVVDRDGRGVQARIETLCLSAGERWLPPTNTDQDGRFRCDGLFPGGRFRITAMTPNLQFHTLAEELSVKSGQTVDLGDLTFGKRTAASNSESKPAKEKEKPTPPAKKRVSESPAGVAAGRRPLASDRVHYEGRVLTPDGTPAAEARLYTLEYPKVAARTSPGPRAVQVGTTDAQGGFQVELATPNFSPRTKKAALIAVADGYGLNWVELEKGERPDTLTLKLVEDQPIRGRILDSEGRPVAQAKMRVVSLFGWSTGRLDELLAGWARVADEAVGSSDRRLHAAFANLLQITPPNEEGRFEIRGLGKERLARMLISGPNITRTGLLVALRKDFDPKPLNDVVANRWSLLVRPGPPSLLFAPSFEFVGEPARIVEGTVREAESGHPVAGARIECSGGSGFTGYLLEVTDAEGHFRFDGIGKVQREFYLSVFPSDQSTLLTRSLKVDNPPGLEPLKIDIELAQGVAVTGRVIDRTTGKGVRADVRFAALPDNKYFGKRPGYDSYVRGRFTKSSADGSFRMVTIPGSIVLVAWPREADEQIDGVPVSPYKKAEFSEDELKRVELTDDGRRLVTARGFLPLHLFQTAKVLDVDEKARAVTCDLYFDRGKTIDVRIEDARGQPLAGAFVGGMTAVSSTTFRAKEPSATIYALDPQKPRRVFFYHPQRKLAGSLTLRGDEDQPPTVRLSPTLTFTGRAVHNNGQPVAGAEVSLAWRAGALYWRLREMRDPVLTDDDGKFVVDGVFPNVGYNLSFAQDKTPIPLVPEDSSDTTTSVDENNPAKTVDLGDIRVKPQQ